MGGIDDSTLYGDVVVKSKRHGDLLSGARKHSHSDRLKDSLSVEILRSIDAGAINEKGVRGLASELHISERHLRRIVQNRTGLSPMRLNRVRRLSTAKRLISQTELPIIEVAFRAGFSSLRQFNAVFKSVFRISPRDMRRNLKKGCRM